MRGMLRAAADGGLCDRLHAKRYFLGLSAGRLTSTISWTSCPIEVTLISPSANRPGLLPSAPLHVEID